MLFRCAFVCVLLVLASALAFLHPNPRTSSTTVVVLLIVSITPRGRICWFVGIAAGSHIYK